MSPDRQGRHLVILGLMASGKSTVGRLVADRLDRPLLDNDEALDRLIGRTAAEHVEQHGLAALHELEAQVLREGLARAEPAVVTAAASVGDRADLPHLVGDHFVVWLDVDPLVLSQRVAPGGDHRPFDGEVARQLQQQRERRAPNFTAAADLVVTWHQQSPEDLADEVVRQFALDVP